MKNEKKIYEKARAEIVYVEKLDVILTSSIDLPDIPLTTYYSQDYFARTSNAFLPTKYYEND